jgi:tetratricopeptide (TPR) repeat protein
VARDRAFWDSLASDLLARSDFRRNADARNCFAKLRAAIAGVYDFREMLAEAEYALKQAINLCPESEDASFRLAQLYLRKGRYAEARAVMKAYQTMDCENRNAQAFLRFVISTEKDESRRKELERELGPMNGVIDSDGKVELAGIYQRQEKDAAFEKLTQSLITDTNLPPRSLRTLAMLCRDAGQWELMATAFRRLLQSEPNDYKEWADLGAIELILKQPNAALTAFKRAVEIGGDEARNLFRYNLQIQQLRTNSEFEALLNERQSRAP